MRLSYCPRQSNRSAPAPQRRARTNQFEALEGRVLFSTLTVTNTHDHGAGSLRAEIAAAHNGDTIVFASSLFHAGKTTKITLSSGELTLAKNLTIQGPGANKLNLFGNWYGLSPLYWPDNTTTPSRGFEIAAKAKVTLSGLTISGGDGVASASSSATWNHFGGALLNHGTLTVSSCTVSGSSAWNEGGGIFSDKTLTVSHSTISGNYAYVGAGVSNHRIATFTSDTISKNYGTDLTSDNYHPATEGGGIFNHGTLTVSGCTVSGNFATSGGGIFNQGTVTIKSSSRITGSLNSDDAANFGVLYLDGTSTIGVLDGNVAIRI